LKTPLEHSDWQTRNRKQHKISEAGTTMQADEFAATTRQTCHHNVALKKPMTDSIEIDKEMKKN
jgi:hypothetical protein